MSKGGGAGKVYFVLYLAVVLELLIIIVERDEAEEHLHKRQKEAMKIVESILSQMQSGAGTEGINTRPQDEITIPPSGVNMKEVMGADLKAYRRYIVEVGVTDVTSEMAKKDMESDKEYQQRLEKLVQLASVEQIQYQIFFNPSQDPDYAPAFPSDKFLKDNKVDFKTFEPGQMITGEFPEESWEFLGLYELNLDMVSTFNKLDPSRAISSDIVPEYPNELKFEIGNIKTMAPPDIVVDSIFHYSIQESSKKATGSTNLQKRAFVVNFQPPSKSGWYKLRFYSQTNRILGVKAEENFLELSNDATVNIGTVQLSVGDLRKVQKELMLSLEKYGMPTTESLAENGDLDYFMDQLEIAKTAAREEPEHEETLTKINLYGYIAKLLAPGQSSNFDQNRGSIEFNIRVVTPEPQLADPIVKLPEEFATFDEVEPTFHLTISPYQDNNALEGRVLDQTENVVARVAFTPADQLADISVGAPTRGGSREYRAVVDKVLPAGKYKVEVSHKLMGKEGRDQMRLDIFETKLTDDSKQLLERNLDLNAYFGFPLNFKVEPSSGGKIKANQFRIDVNTDVDTQRPAIEGLSIPTELQKEYAFSPESKQIKVRVYWIQPHTGKEIDLYAENTFDIKQDSPKIATNQASVDVSGTTQRLQVSIQNVRVTKPSTGKEGVEANVNLAVVGNVDVLVPGYNLATEPSIEQIEDGVYNVFFELAGALERGQTAVQGTFSLRLSAVATNPVNGVRSEPIQSTFNESINFTPDRMGGPRRR